MPSRPSMHEIARQAGVSTMSVSCALRGVEGVSAETRAAILRVAEKLGYRPDPLLSHLMHHLRSRRAPKNLHNIALLHWPRDSYRALVVAGARQRAERHGYRLDVIEMTAALTPAALRRMLRARGVAGLVLGPSPVTDFTALLDWERYAVVGTSYSVVAPKFHRIVPDQYAATLLALRALRGRGYRRVGLLVPKWVEERVNFLHSVAFAWDGVQARQRPLLWYAEDKKSGASGFRRWFDQARPDALVLCSPLDYEAVVADALGREQVRTLGIVSLGYDTQCAGTTTVDYQPALMGSVAVDQLINQLHRGERGVPAQQQTLSIEGRWIEGDSLRPAGTTTAVPPRPRPRRRAALR